MQTLELIIFGSASQREIKKILIDASSKDASSKLMSFLLEHHIPVASSCNGEGICRKCIVKWRERPLMSCQVSLADIFENTSTQETLHFSYL